MLRMRARIEKNQHHDGNDDQRDISFTSIQKKRKCGNKITKQYEDFLEKSTIVHQHRKRNEQQEEIVVVQVWADEQGNEQRGAQQKLMCFQEMTKGVKHHTKSDEQGECNPHSIRQRPVEEPARQRYRQAGALRAVGNIPFTLIIQ